MMMMMMMMMMHLYAPYLSCIYCRISLGSESGIYEFPSGKLRLHEVGSRNYEWESGPSRHHPEFPS